jgi:hypothetical protein
MTEMPRRDSSNTAGAFWLGGCSDATRRGKRIQRARYGFAAAVTTIPSGFTVQPNRRNHRGMKA